MKRLLFITDDSTVAQWVRLALKEAAGFQLAGVAGGRRSARAVLLGVRPDVVLVDNVCDPRVAGELRGCGQTLARLREASELVPASQCLLLTLRMEEAWMSEVFDAGAHAVLSKAMHPVSLGTMLREIVRGNIVHRVEPRPSAAAGDCSPTLREKGILALVAEGATKRADRADALCHRADREVPPDHTYRKLGVANRTEASHYAHVNNLVTAAEALAW